MGQEKGYQRLCQGRRGGRRESQINCSPAEQREEWQRIGRKGKGGGWGGLCDQLSAACSVPSLSLCILSSLSLFISACLPLVFEATVNTGVSAFTPGASPQTNATNHPVSAGCWNDSCKVPPFSFYRRRLCSPPVCAGAFFGLLPPNSF